MARTLRSITFITAILLLSLTACNFSAPQNATATEPTQVVAVAVPTATAQPTSTSTVTRTPEPTNTPTATYTPTPISGAACLTGQWQVTDPANFVASLTEKTKATAQVLNNAGPITYQFKPDGTAHINADQFKLKMKVPVSGFPINLDVTINGEATANYAAPSSDQLKFSNAQLDGLHISAKVGNRELFAGTANEMADMFGFSLDPLFNTSMYDCRADTFKYRPLPDASAVILKRMQ